MDAIRTVDITKKYGDFTANEDINISITSGEITAIVGENGAGKTTLMNMFYGLHHPTSGELYVKGERVHFGSPLDAINYGLGMVHQHFKLVPSLTVFENIMLGTEITRKISLGSGRSLKLPLIDRKAERKKVKELIDSYKIDLDPDEKVENISIGSRQRVEILKMLYRNVDILIFDEPTAVLTPQEVDELLQNLKELKQQGKTIILITHKLREVMDVSDRIYVIKRGRIAGFRLTSETNPAEIANLMVGRDVLLEVKRDDKDDVAGDAEKPKTVLDVENLGTVNHLGKKVLDGITFHINEGEILGIAGVEGNGQSELAKVLSGLMRTTEGHIRLNGKEITNDWPAELRRSGVGIIPDDRFAHGLCKEMSIADNLIAGYHSDRKYCTLGMLNKKNIVKNRDVLLDKYDIRTAEADGTVAQLSGGNAQKIVIAREFESDPDFLIASQPTRGVDIGSIEFIHKKLLELRAQKKAILLISSELSEITGLSDRIAVMYKGRIVGEVSSKEANNAKLGLLMAGITH